MAQWVKDCYANMRTRECSSTPVKGQVWWLALVMHWDICTHPRKPQEGTGSLRAIVTLPVWVLGTKL